MAQRRMFSPDIVSSEEFLSMPVSSRELYFQLGMNADDDGFIQPKLVMRIAGATDDDLKVLLAKRFLLSFQNGVVVIKHWLIHNMIRADRYKPTRFQDEKKTLFLKENRAYTDQNPLGLQNGNQMAPQYRLGKVSIGKVRLDKESSRFAPPSLQEVTDYCLERKNGIDPSHFIDFYSAKGWLIGKNKMKDWKAAVRTWEGRKRGETITNKLKAPAGKYENLK